MNVTRVRNAQPIGHRPGSGQIGFFRVTTDDQTARIRNPGECLEQQVDTLPRIKVSGVGDDPARLTILAVSGSIGRPHAVWNDRHSRSHAEPMLQFDTKRRGNRDIPIGSLPDARFASGEPLQFARRRTGRRGDELGQRGSHVGRITMRFVNERRSQPLGQFEQRRCDTQVAGQQHVGARATERPPDRERQVPQPPRQGWSGNRRHFDA